MPRWLCSHLRTFVNPGYYYKSVHSLAIALARVCSRSASTCPEINSILYDWARDSIWYELRSRCSGYFITASGIMDPANSDEMSDIREIEYPRDLLERVWAAQFKPYPHGQKTDNPNPTWVFVLYHDIDESGTDDRTTSIVEGIFTTLEKANEAALNFFIEDYAAFFDQKEDMSNFFEVNTVNNDGFNTVEWNILYDGGVSLEATNSEGPKIHVYVQSHELE